MSNVSLAPRPPLWRRALRGLAWLFVGSRRLVVNLLWLAVLVGVAAWVFSPGTPALKDKTTLVLDLAGPIVEQRPGLSRESALGQLGGNTESALPLRDVLAVLDAAARDPKVTQALLMLDDLEGAGLSTLREVSAAIQRFKAAGKPVYAWGSHYDQRSLYLAVQADQVFLHPMGHVMLQGYGRPRNYYKDLFDKVGVTAHVLKVGTYKSFGEPFSQNAPSEAALAADKLLYDDLWRLWTTGVETARKLPPGSVMAAIDGLPGNLQAVGGDYARLSVELKLVDALKTRDEVRTLLMEKGAPDADGKTFRQVRLADYLPRVKPPGKGDGIGVVVAEGEISDGEAPTGKIGGLSTAALIRQAREDDSVKAIVLRVRSPGGSAFGSELVRRELELARTAGKPVVVSMGDVAASGGYWISTASDEVIADEATVTGSIGVVAILPSFERAMDKVGVRRGGYSTTWLGSALDLQQGLDPRVEKVMQAGIEHAYRQFTGLAAKARNTTPEKIDAVAQGRVWTGGQALERGLVDRTGSFADALAAARTRAKLGEDAPVRYIEREPGRLSRLLEMAGQQSSLGSALDAAIGRTLASLGLQLAPALGAPAVAAAASPDLAADLGWLSDVAQRKRPFEAMVHCLCEAP